MNNKNKHFKVIYKHLMSGGLVEDVFGKYEDIKRKYEVRHPGDQFISIIPIEEYEAYCAYKR